jgi:hypothetical protein
MTEYQIQPPSRRCTVTGRELKPGERFFTALLEEGEQFRRQDYSSEAWTGPPANAFGFWSGRVPSADPSRRPTIDDDLLADCFQRLEGQQEPHKLSFRYVLALLLMRRKRLRFEEARVESGREIMRLRCSRTREVYEVINPGLTADQLAAAQDEVFKLLGWE